MNFFQRLILVQLLTLLVLAAHINLSFCQVSNKNPIVLPENGGTSLVVESGQTYNATSAVSITLKSGVYFKKGSSVLLQINNTGSLAPNNPNDNLDMNWTLARSFDASGATIGETKSFFDDNGSLIQTQSKNIEAGHVLAVQPLYDVGRKSVGSTMSAPINNASFSFKPDFALATSSASLNYRNYGRYIDGAIAKIEDKSFTPDPIYKSGEGTLGWYYSSKNNLEPLIDITDYPYSTSVGPRNGTNVMSTSGGVGAANRMGSGHENIQFTVNASQELMHYIVIRASYFKREEMGELLISSTPQMLMNVNIDADKHYSASISIGGRTVMTAQDGDDLLVDRSGPVGVGNRRYFPILREQSLSGFAGTIDDGRTLTNYDGSKNVMLKPGLYEMIGSTHVDCTFGFSNITYTFYDQLGRVKAIIPPEGVKRFIKEGRTAFSQLTDIPFVKTFDYDGKGNLITSTDPDAGKTEFKYSADGKLRFSQNALQRENNKFSYTNYDQYGRTIESGELLPSGTLTFATVTQAGLNAINTAASNYLTGTKFDVTVIKYDITDKYDIADATLSSYVQDSYFLSGSAVSSKAKYNGAAVLANLVAKTWYNYDGDGNVLWTVKYAAGLGYKTIDYTYDDLGNVTKSIYQKNKVAETLVHYFEYDKNKRLVAAYTNMADNDATKILHAKYNYYLHGPLKRVELGDKLQGLDYVYGIDGKLKSINNANATKDPGRDGGDNGFAADVFGMNFEYHPDDYSNSAIGLPSIQTNSTTVNYSGNINGISWFSKKPSSSDIAPVMNTFAYDALGQLKESNWGKPNYTNASFILSKDINQERELSYDSHGNIKNLTRIGITADTKKIYSYNYQANTNKLTSVTGYANYTYDPIGRLASQVKGAAGMYLAYDVSGKVTKIYSDATKETIILSFVYDDDGNRIQKKDHRTNAVTYYSYNGNGSLVAIFEQQGTGPVKLTEQPIYGAERLGTLYKQANNYQYTITDHVGNTRVVINRNKKGDAVDIVYYADYYPFGSELRSAGTESRYGYQGQYAEKDKETGWNNFELRNYDSAIGRWLTTDPYGQYHSPYVGMGNNPISGFDVDGGWSDNDNIGVNKNGTVVFNDGIDDGNLYLVNDGIGQIKNLEMLKNNSVQLAKDYKWVGTNQQKIDYVKSQWLHAEGGFDWFAKTNNFLVKNTNNSFSVGVFYENNGDSDVFMNKTVHSHEINFTINDKGGRGNLLSNPYNTRNAISHEKRHLHQAVKIDHGSLINPTRSAIELDAINYQRSSDSWIKTTNGFKNTVKTYENKYKN